MLFTKNVVSSRIHFTFTYMYMSFYNAIIMCFMSQVLTVMTPNIADAFALFSICKYSFFFLANDDFRATS